MKKMCYEVKKFWENEDGMGVVEVVLITIENYLISYSL